MLLSSFLVYAALAQDSEPKTISLTDAERALVEQNSDFAFNLFRKTRDTENHVISPLSITYALGMLNNGADGITREEICQVLSGGQQEGYADVAAMNSFCKKMLTESALLDENTRVAIANTIFFNGDRGDISLKSAFKEAAATYYDASPSIVSFSDPATLGVINQWASDHTDGMISDLLKEGDLQNPDLVSFLLNAICFKGAWDAGERLRICGDRPISVRNPALWQRFLPDDALPASTWKDARRCVGGHEWQKLECRRIQVLLGPVENAAHRDRYRPGSERGHGVARYAECF